MAVGLLEVDRDTAGTVMPILRLIVDDNVPACIEPPNRAVEVCSEVLEYLRRHEGMRPAAGLNEVIEEGILIVLPRLVLLLRVLLFLLLLLHHLVLLRLLLLLVLPLLLPLLCFQLPLLRQLLYLRHQQQLLKTYLRMRKKRKQVVVFVVRVKEARRVLVT